MTLTPRQFWSQVDMRRKEECWPWMGAGHSGGYGTLRWHGVKTYAHRVAYELRHGPIPAGHQIDHLCRNRLCANPSHLEAVTQKENIFRGNGWAGQHFRKTHCPQGHPYSGENLMVDSNGHRRCRECDRAKSKRGYLKRKEQTNA